MRSLLDITRALSDAHRLRALLALRGGELCVCQVTELMGLAPSTISRHLSILSRAGLVCSRKEGRWMYYRLPGKRAPVAVREALDWVEKSLARDPQVVGDGRTLRRIVRLDPEELCRRQCQK